MKPHATITLAYHGLELRCPAAGISEDRPLTDEDFRRFSRWTTRHQELARKSHPAADLLQLGREIFDWLDGATQFLSRLPDTATPPLLIEFAIGREDSPLAHSFLDAPWELLAHAGRHWSLRSDIIFCPVRRIGKAVEPPPPSPNRLSVVFMAAAPRGEKALSYEAEEASILTATRDITLDLVVEESGTLGLLSACVAREKPDVVHISCHGRLAPEPGLQLEDDVGDPAFVKTSHLVTRLAAHHPRMLFLSACETAEGHPVLDSLARALVRSGVPAVLGWAAPVLDAEATIFASHLYEHLTRGEDLAQAVAYARLDLGQSEQLPEPPHFGPRSRDWHLARLYLSPAGGGALATADGPSRLAGRGYALKAFLDAKGKQVPVAGELEFVGRRREIQKILREFRAPASLRHAGVLVHGLGRQGKSSLAARVAHRLENTHETLVLYGRYDATAVLCAFRDRLATPAVAAIVNRHFPEVAEHPERLLTALTELLEGPCAQQKKDPEGRPTARPVLLVIDDFEQALEERKTGRHVLTPDFVEPIRAVIRAFNDARTDSRLLFTSRVQFTLPDGAADLAGSLLDVPLHGMEPHDAGKQAAAKLRFESAVSPQKLENLPALLGELDRIIGAAQGNPGLQDILFSLSLENPAACGRCLDQMEEYRRSGKLPEEDKVRQFLEDLAIGALLGLLTGGQRELLRASTLFELPVPLPVMRLLARQGDQPPGEEGIARLVALGLVEVYEDLHRPHEPALLINAIVHPLAGALTHEEQRELALVACPALFERWGGEAGGRKRGYLQDYELTRLALLAFAPHVLAATGARTLRYLDGRFEYRKAAEWAKRIVAALDASGVLASVDLLRTASEASTQVGEVAEAGALRGRALAAIKELERQGGKLDPEQHAATLLVHGRALVEQGRPDEALQYLERARHLFPQGREQAIVLGDIARLRAAKGEVDAALQLHTERLGIFEGLGDKRSRAGALGDIARLRADRGEVDASLELHEEILGICEALGDRKGRAVTLGDIARILSDKGEVDAALKLHQEELAVYDELGDKRSRAGALGDIARLRAAKGEVDAALQLHQERLGVYEELGEKRSTAVALGDIARILSAKGEVDAALKLHNESLGIFEGLGDKRSRAVTLGDIARIRADKGEVDAALKLHNERLGIFEGLEDQAEIAHTLWSIAQIELQRRKFQEALEHLAKSYGILLKLGRLDGICRVGLDLGSLLCASGHREAGREILTRSREGFRQLGRSDMVRLAQALIDQFSEPSA